MISGDPVPSGLPKTWLDAWRSAGHLDGADLRFVAWLGERARRARTGSAEDEDALTLVACALCRAAAEGALCLSLDPEELGDSLQALLVVAEPGDAKARGARFAARFRSAADAGAFRAVLGDPTAPRPLMRTRGGLYLHRLWFAQQVVAEELARRTDDATRGLFGDDAPSGDAIAAILRETLDENPLRAPGGGALVLTPLQREALAVALREPVFVLSGGPGTGKTTWTAAWLRALLRLPGVTPGRVRLCAPTGRAARRLAESLRERLEGGEDAADEAARTVPVATLHGLLGYRAFDGSFARGPGDPIDADWILLDEASMTDVFLLAILLRSLRPGCRLVLAGDPDQLPPVEAGSVLAELLPGFAGDEGPVPSVTLDAGHRAQGAVAALAAAVRAGDAASVLAALGDAVPERAALDRDRPVARIEPGDGKSPLAALMRVHADATFGTEYEGLLDRFRAAPIEEEARIADRLWRRAGRARVLAPLRRGPVGAEAANRELRELLEPAWRRPGDRHGAGFHGAPILVTRNDERVGLSNGDVGLWLESGGGATVFFPGAAAPDGWLRIPAALLPPHELGFAATVHKSQGSEYDSVLILLPEEGNPLLARETLYTAVTRAREAARILGTEAAIREATGRRLRRPGGLREAMADARAAARRPQPRREPWTS